MRSSDITHSVALTELAKGARIYEVKTGGYLSGDCGTHFYLLGASGDEVQVPRDTFMRLNRRDEIERIDFKSWQISPLGMRRSQALEAMR